MKLPIGLSVRRTWAAVEELKKINNTLEAHGRQTGFPGVKFLIQELFLARSEGETLRRRLWDKDDHIRAITEELYEFRRTTVRIAPDFEPTPLEQAARRSTGIDLGLTTASPVMADTDETRKDRIMSYVDYPDIEPREFPIITKGDSDD